MKINLTICGVHELADQEGKRWTHVISIWDKRFLYDTSCREKVKAVAPRAEVLFNFFEDTDDPTHPDAPRLQDVKRILAFTSQLPTRAKILVHCRAGISRSTATASRFEESHMTYTTNIARAMKAMARPQDRELAIEMADERVRRWKIFHKLAQQAEAWTEHRKLALAARQTQASRMTQGIHADT